MGRKKKNGRPHLLARSPKHINDVLNKIAQPFTGTDHEAVSYVRTQIPDGKKAIHI